MILGLYFIGAAASPEFNFENAKYSNKWCVGGWREAIKVELVLPKLYPEPATTEPNCLQLQSRSIRWVPGRM